MVSRAPPPVVAEGVPVPIPSETRPVTLFDPTADGWDVTERTLDCNIWRNRNTGVEVQEYRIVAND